MKSSLRFIRRSAAAVIFAALAVFARAADVRVYVVHAPGQKAAVQAALAQAQARTHHVFDDLGAVAVTIPEQARAALQRNPAVELVEDDPVRGLLSATWTGQIAPYGIGMVQAPAAVSAGATGAGIKVGVIDSGVFAAHEDFAGVTITGAPDGDWNRDANSHGTHVVGTIAAANNTQGVIGVSPGAVSIHMVKVFGDDGSWVYSSDLLAACRAARTAGSKIISMSLGGSFKSRTEDQGMADLYKNGILLIAAAGNGGNTQVSYPAGYSSVMSVAAIDINKVVATFSQKNSDVEIAAPGVGVLSTVSYIDTTSVTVDGASYDAGHVEFSARTPGAGVSANLIYGGLGDATNAAWSGKIVLVDRGTISFYDKVRNVQQSGGVGCIIANNEPGGFAGTLGAGNSSTIPAISVSQEDGATLKSKVGLLTTVTSQMQEGASGYDYFDGTSMATPHVAGVAALIWSKYTNATNAQVRQALVETAEDLGAAGRDTAYGWGLVRAVNALGKLGTLVGSNPPPPSSGDTTPPVISNVAHQVTNAKNGSFDITWTTNEPATSDVQINGTLYPDPDSTLVTSHRRSFRGSKGVTYNYIVISADAAGNSAQGTGGTLKL